MIHFWIDVNFGPNGQDYCEYVPLHTDDTLVISENAKLSCDATLSRKKSRLGRLRYA